MEKMNDIKKGDLVYDINIGCGIILDKKTNYVDVVYKNTHQFYDIEGFPINIKKERITDQPMLTTVDIDSTTDIYIKHYLSNYGKSLNRVATMALFNIYDYWMEDKGIECSKEDILKELKRMLDDEDIFIPYLYKGNIRELRKDIEEKNYFNVFYNYEFIFFNRNCGSKFIIDVSSYSEMKEVIGRNGENVKRIANFLSKKLYKKIRIKVEL